MRFQDTICAVATPPGRGGIGVVRLSGAQAQAIGLTLTDVADFTPRRAQFARFYTADLQVLDEGLVLWFPAPHSFTGEAVVELQGHGGPVVLDMLVQRCVQLGARLAQPGEFSERAFLNDKLDLAQAEAIADLIDCQTETAARLAMRSLQGEFSQRVHTVVSALIRLRLYVEAAIDFPEEEVDFLAESRVQADLQTLVAQVADLQAAAQRGRVVREGITLVIAGHPNAGKSSLMNALAGVDAAIVTDIPGTTRDVLREHIQLEGVPVQLVDTAGLRLNPGVIEQQGIQRARQAMAEADRVLWVYDGATGAAQVDHDVIPPNVPVTLVHNKADLSGMPLGCTEMAGRVTVALCARDQRGMDHLRQHLAACLGLDTQTEGDFMARRRHLVAIAEAADHLDHACQHALAGELLAEDLRLSQLALAQITGEFSADDLLGAIFSQFCIGK